MVRPTNTTTARTVLYGLAVPIALALITLAAKQYDAGKLDTPRFVADSIDTFHQRNELRAVLFRIDSTTRETRRMVAAVCARSTKGCP